MGETPVNVSETPVNAAETFLVWDNIKLHYQSYSDRLNVFDEELCVFF